MELSIHVTGVEEAITKLSPATITGELQGALEVMGNELSTSKGGGLGVQVNTLTQNVTTGLVVVESTLVWPRTTGESWLLRSQQEGEIIGTAALEAAGARIAEAMA